MNQSNSTSTPETKTVFSPFQTVFGRTIPPVHRAPRCMRQTPAENEYDAMPKEERAAHFYRPYEKHRHARREFGQYRESLTRLLPMAPKSAPMTRDVMAKLFRGTSGKTRRAERQAKKDAARLQRHLAAEAKRNGQ